MNYLNKLIFYNLDCKNICYFFPIAIAGSLLSTHLLWLCMPDKLHLLYQTYGGDYYKHYLPLAHKILSGNAFISPDSGTLDTWFPPGYSTYLAGLLWVNDWLGLPFEGFRILACNWILVPLTITGLYLLWRLANLGSIWAALAALAYAFYPLYNWASITALSTCLFTLLFVWTCVAWAKISHEPSRLIWYCAFGVGLGLSMLVRPIVLFVPFFAVLMMFLRRQPRKGIICMIVCLIVLIAPWIIIASIAKGHFVLMSSNGMYTVTRYGMFNYFPDNPVTKELQRNIAAQRYIIDFLVFSLDQLFTNTSASLALWGEKIIRAWYGTASQNRVIQTGIAVMNFLVLASATCGVLLNEKSNDSRPINRDLAINLLFLLVYFWLITALSGTLVRYMVPAMWIPLGGSVLVIRWMVKYVTTNRT